MLRDRPVPVEPGDGPIRMRMDLAYDGLAFAGWARQQGQRTVQGEIERVLGHLLGQSVALVCAGRTDAGVHARGQVTHFDLPSGCPRAPSLHQLNRALPHDIRVKNLDRALAGFDARFSALWRRYSYRVCDQVTGPDPLERHRTLRWSRSLDEAAMNAAASRLLGEHDFAAFCKARATGSTIRTLQGCTWTRQSDGVLLLGIKADAFCHSMVRSLVGALLPVGDGRRSIDWPVEVLRGRERDSSAMVMPAHPLVLEEVGYPCPGELLARQAITRQVRGTGESLPRHGTLPDPDRPVIP